MKRTQITIFALLGGAATLAATPAQAQKREIHPYIEVGQILTADLQTGDVLTYSTVGVGIDASVQTRRVELQLSYKFERRFAYDNALADDSVHSGIARAAVKIVPGISIEAGGIATRARTDSRGAVAGNAVGNQRNISQVYAGYVGPTVATKVGVATVNAAYRFGYTKVEASNTVTGVPAGQPGLDTYDDSTSHMATASVGVRAGAVLPIGFTVSAGYEREDAGQLDQRYEGKFGRADAVLPVAPTLALVGGVGYEKIEISQRDPLLDATGQPVRDANGRYLTDPASPRRLSYNTDGLFWDAGVVFKPGRRTTLQARAGRRYDSMTYTGSLSYQPSKNTGLQIGVYDGIQSFGRGISNGLAALPTSFETPNDPLGQQFGGCVYGSTGAAAGGCLNSSLGALSTANFRSRGVDAVLSSQAGGSTIGMGAGYANRRFLVPNGTPAAAAILRGVTDQSYYAQVFVGRTLTARSSVNANFYGTYFDSGIAGGPDVFGTGMNGSYNYSIGRFGATASAGLFASDQEGVANDVSAQAALGMRYSF
jgi:hypothetical protein